MAAIVIVMFLFFLVMGILAATVPYSTPALESISNYDRVRFQAFREAFVDKEDGIQAANAHNYRL